MCGTIDNLFEKPSNLPRALGNLSASVGDPLGQFVFSSDANNIGTVAQNPLLSTAATGLAGYFGGPWGAGLAQTSLAKERGNDWGTALTQGAVAGGMAYGAGQLGGASAGGENATGGYGGDATAAGYDPSYGSTAADTSAAGSQQADWYQPTDTSTVGAGGSTSPGTMDYGMGSADMSQANYPQAGDQSFSLGDWLKSGSFSDKLQRYNMLQGGMKTLGGLYDYQAKNTAADDLMNRYNQEKSAMDAYYAAGSPEAKAMEEEMARKDAAAGRNSQYGTRAVNLAAALAQTRANYRANMAPGLNQLYGTATALRGSAPQTMISGLGQMGTGYLAGLF